MRWSHGLVLAALLVSPAQVDAAGYADEILKDAPAAYWRLGEKSLDDLARDGSGNSVDGVYRSFGRAGLEVGQEAAVVGDPDTAVRLQTCLGFKCDDSGQIQMPAGGPLDLGVVGGATLTLEAWFKLLPNADAALALSAFPRIVHYNHSELGQYSFGVVGDENADFPDRRTVWAALGAGSASGGLIKAGPCGAIWPGVHGDWYHFAATIRSTATETQIRLFLNGTELTDVEDSDPIYWAIEQATVGGRYQEHWQNDLLVNDPVQGFPGVLDEVAVYPHLLSAERIRAHFVAGRPPPTARFSASPKNGVAPLAVHFDASASTPPADATIAELQWHFGDGTVGTGVVADHTYSFPGVYQATLRVESSLGATDFAAEGIRVEFTSQDVTPWKVADLGDPSPSGSAPEGACLEVFAAGRGVGGDADSCRFAYQERRGDFAFVAKINGLRWQLRGQASVMLRASLEPDSAMAAVSIESAFRTTRIVFRHRAGGVREAHDDSVRGGLPADLKEIYLGLGRWDGNLIGVYSTDGVSFVELPCVPDPGLPDPLLAGVAVSGADADCTGGAATVLFCDIGFPNGVPRTPFHRGDADESGRIDVSDAIFLLRFLFLDPASRPPPCNDAADADDNEILELTDAVRVLGYLFLGEGTLPDPGPPGLPCGVDEPCGALTCDQYTQCGSP